jgi:endonuclease YncB( thermonuclease family)
MNTHWRLRCLTVFLVAVVSAPLAAEDFSGKVLRVLDGDTIEVMRDGKPEKVWLHGVDCPEAHQAYGKKAKQFTAELVLEKDVTVKVVEKDANGRVLGEVALPDGRSLNRELVRQGLAWWYEEYAKDDRVLEDLEFAARTQKRGLWIDPAATPPWEFRKGAGDPDVALLRAQLEKVRAERDALEAALAEKDAEIARLRLQVEGPGAPVGAPSSGQPQTATELSTQPQTATDLSTRGLTTLSTRGLPTPPPPVLPQATTAPPLAPPPTTTAPPVLPQTTTAPPVLPQTATKPPAPPQTPAAPARQPLTTTAPPVLPEAETEPPTLPQMATKPPASAQAETKSPASAQAATKPPTPPQTGTAPSADAGQDAVMVYITRTGREYHREGCRDLEQGKIAISLRGAKVAGYKPCSKCGPPR